MTKEKMKEAYVMISMIEQEMKNVTQQVQELNSKLIELEYIKISLDVFSQLKPGQEVLAPFANGIFIRTELKNSSELVVNVGSGTVVTKDVSQTKVLLDRQVAEIASFREELIGQLQALSEKSSEVEAELKKLIKEARHV